MGDGMGDGPHPPRHHPHHRDWEEEYFAREQRDLLKRAREQARQQLHEAEMQRLKELHWMHCPRCGMELALVDYRGVKVEACFHCGGMFFDPAEVEKIASYREPGWLDQMARWLTGTETE